MKRQLITLLIAFFSQINFGISQEQVINKSCPCFYGVGSTENDSPIFTFEFSNKQRVSICGFWDHETHDSNDSTQGFIISEFNIFNCKTGYSYAEFGALETCRIIHESDLIEIQYLQYLPTGNKWSWELVIIAKQFVKISSDSLTVTPLNTCYVKQTIQNDLETSFLKDIKRNNGFDLNWEEEIGKLQVLALNGNKDALEILFNYEKIKGQETDGAIAEMWADAKATVKWVLEIK